MTERVILHIIWASAIIILLIVPMVGVFLIKRKK